MVIELDPDFESAQENIKKSVDLYRTEQLDKAAKSAETGNLNNAVTVIKNALKFLENDSLLTQKLNEYNDIMAENDIKTLLASAKESADNGDLVTAMNILKNAMTTYPNEADIATQYNDYEKSYADSVISEVETMLDERDYDSALKLLESAQKVLPDNMQLSDKYNSLLASKPVELKDIKMQNASKFEWTGDAAEDIVGNVYSGNNMFIANRGYQNRGSCEFYLGSNYSTICGTVVPQSSFDEYSAINFEIYADDVLKYSLKITQKTLATQFEADVSGTEWIMIKLSPISGFRCNYTQTIIYNPVLYKTE